MLRPLLTTARSRVLLPLVALAVVLTGCGSASTPDDETADTAAEAEAEADGGESATAGEGGETGDEQESEGAAADEATGSVLAAAVDESSASTSARTRFTSLVSTPQGDIEVTGEGISTADSASMTMTMSGQTAAAFGADEVEIEVRILEGVMYQRFPQLLEQFGADAEWLEFDLGSLAPEFSTMLDQARQVDPAESLAVLRDVAGVTEVGAETVNGVETTHYTGELDLRTTLEASGIDPATMEGAAGVDLDQPVPVDVWIDGDGLVRRYETSMDVEGTTTTTTFEVLEYGIDVEVTAPPADVTVSFDELVPQQQGG